MKRIPIEIRIAVLVVGAVIVTALMAELVHPATSPFVFVLTYGGICFAIATDRIK